MCLKGLKIELVFANYCFLTYTIKNHPVEILAIWARFLIGDRVKTQAIVTGGTGEARADGGIWGEWNVV